MAKVDPNDKKYDGAGKTPACGKGDKLLAALGFERYRASTGSRCLSVRFLCLRDYAKIGDEKHEVFENFTMEDRSMWVFINFVRAIGYTEPFDPDEDEDIEAILTAGYVLGTIGVKQWQGKDQARIETFAAPPDDGDDPEWAAWIEEGEARHQKYLAWREKNPRGQRSASSGGGSSSHSSGGAGNNDDIPFSLPVAA